jgi:tRNA pseudouridine38-40 synthase
VTEPALPDREGGLVRLRLQIGYDGTDFSGWAVQPDHRTVQGELELALGRVLRLPASPRTVCAGRTDTGVHARGQVAHCDVPLASWASCAEPGETVVLRRLRSALPADLLVRAIGPAPEGFDARFAALSRRYAYRVCDDVAGPDPLLRRTALHRTGPGGAALDLGAMNEAAQPLLGEHDFAAFCRRRDGASTVRTLLALRWRRDAAGQATMDVHADAFCHTMVRSLAGALLAVGMGRVPPTEPARLLAGRVRDPRAVVLPALGLCLEAVHYPPDSELPAVAARARRFRGAVPPAGWSSPEDHPTRLAERVNRPQ